MVALKQLGREMRALRQAQGLSLKAAARRAGIGRMTLIRIEQGVGACRLDSVARLAHALGHPLAEALPVREDAPAA